MAQICASCGLLETELIRFLIRAAVGAEKHIHERSEICVVAGVAIFGMVPVVQLRRAEEHANRADGEADIGMDVDRPYSTEQKEARNRFQWKAEDHGGQVDQSHGVDRIERMLAVGGQPVQMFSAVVDGMEAPEKAHAVLQAVAPIHEEIAHQHHFRGL